MSWNLKPADEARLAVVLAEGRRRGLVGRPTDAVQLGHAAAFVRIVESDEVAGETGTILDLGSGAGLPGLVVAIGLPRSRTLLTDSAARRCRFLEWAVEDLGLGEQVDVVHGRAEDLARAALRESVDVVTSRSFGPPAVTAECARGFLRPGGRLIVSEPPEAELATRWPSEGLASMGYGPARPVEDQSGHFVVLEAVDRCPEDLPRRSGIPAKRPRF